MLKGTRNDKAVQCLGDNQDFDEILGARDVISLQHSRQVGVTKNASTFVTDNQDSGGNKYMCLFRLFFSIH